MAKKKQAEEATAFNQDPMPDEGVAVEAQDTPAPAPEASQEGITPNGVPYPQPDTRIGDVRKY
jgi:hypothetical protein